MSINVINICVRNKLSRQTTKELNKNRTKYEINKLKTSNNTKTLDKQYIKMTIAIQGKFDWNKLEEEAKADIDIARKSTFLSAQFFWKNFKSPEPNLVRFSISHNNVKAKPKFE